MSYGDYLMWRYILGDSKGGGFSILGALIAFMLIAAGLGITIEFALEYIPKWLQSFYLWTEPFRTLFFQDFFLKWAAYLLPVGVIYTIIHAGYGLEINENSPFAEASFVIAAIAGVVVGICRIIFRIAMDNWTATPDLSLDHFWISLAWLPVYAIYYVSLAVFIVWGVLTVVGTLYIWFSLALNAIATQKAQKRYDEYYDRQYAAYLNALPQPVSIIPEMRAFEETLTELVAQTTEPEYNPPVVNNAHEKVYFAAMTPIFLFFWAWFFLCLGGCVYLLI